MASAAQLGRGTRLSDDRFPDPFCDMASLAMPDNIQESHEWCEFILQANGPYRQAIERVISYFITDVEISKSGTKGIGREEREKFGQFLDETLGIKTVMFTVALDYLTYGNSFTSVYMPFRRYLSCKSCGFESPLKKVFNSPEFNFQWSNFEFIAQCPQCHYHGSFRHVDRRSGEHDGIKIKRWNPKEIDLIWDPYSDDVSYIWKIPDNYRQLIRRGHLHHLERASWEVIQAVKHNQHLLFDKDVIYHMKEEPLAGVRNGWGISRVLTNFRQAWYLQLLQRYNEAIALDYVIPFRVLTPTPKAGGESQTSDPVAMLGLANFVSRVSSMIRARRKDPARWNVLPFGLDYKALGGDATQLAPKDLLDQALQTLMSSVGVPMEFFQGNLSTQAAPAALRLFEANWSHLVHKLNRFLGRVVNQVSKLLSWEPVSAKLQRVTHADDLNRQMAKLQLMTQKGISATTGLRSVGLDFAEEQRQLLEEERYVAEEQQRMQQEMQQAAQMDQLTLPPGESLGGGPAPNAQQAAGPGGAPPQGGAPPGGDPAQQGMMAPPSALDQFMSQRVNTPHVPRTPEELSAQAQVIAQELMAQPDGMRQSKLIRLKKVDPVMHAMVRSTLDDMQQQAETAGKQLIMQQQYGKTASVDDEQLDYVYQKVAQFIELV